MHPVSGRRWFFQTIMYLRTPSPPPPPRPRNGRILSICQDDFHSFLNDQYTNHYTLLICDDFNLHIHNPNDRAALNYPRTLDAFNLRRHVSVPNHLRGDNLDLLITRCRVIKYFFVGFNTEIHHQRPLVCSKHAYLILA